MKYMHWLKAFNFLFLIGLFCTCRSSDSKLEIIPVSGNVCSQNIDSLYGLIGATFENKPRVALMNLRKILSTQSCSDTKYLTIGNCLLNMGSIYHERLNNLDSSIYYLSSSYNVFNTNKDTLNACNVSKYLGLLNVESGNVSKGMSQIESSLKYFKDSGNKRAYFVSLRNHAKALSINGQNKLALEKMKSVVKFWEDESDQGRLEIYQQELNEMMLGAKS